MNTFYKQRERPSWVAPRHGEDSDVEVEDNNHAEDTVWITMKTVILTIFLMRKFRLWNQFLLHERENVCEKQF